MATAFIIIASYYAPARGALILEMTTTLTY